MSSPCIPEPAAINKHTWSTLACVQSWQPSTTTAGYTTMWGQTSPVAAGQGPLPSAGKLCHVTFPSLEAWDKAHPMVVLGDVLSDLPPVSTFCQAEGAFYLGAPQSITQAWLRRDPPAGQV